MGGLLPHTHDHRHVDVPPVEAEARSPNTYLPPEPAGYEYPVPEKPFETPGATTFRIVVTTPVTPAATTRAATTPVPVTDAPTPPKMVTQPHKPRVPIVEVPEETHEHPEHHHEHAPYEFRYAVLDENEGTDFSETAVADEDGVIRGEYRVLLPDGRRQIVTYVADWREGYNADVQYEGTAVYPPAGETNRKQRSSNSKRRS
ncbi:UNVERIFIED_CONTAM: hypothetical protein B566_EDAN018865 [Ephemera danica]|nr:hypothetical protein B566_EDAN018865 [Ephemera danica]